MRTREIYRNSIHFLSESWKRRSRLKRASVCIQKEKRRTQAYGGVPNLWLKGLGLNSEDLEILIPQIKKDLPGLKILSLSSNSLKTLPDGLFGLSQLENLDLKGNQIETLPSAIARLSKLKHLWLSNNRLVTLPESLGELSELNSLYLPGNVLESLPENLGNLSRLEILSLAKNQLQSLPDSIKNLTELKFLVLTNNHIKTLPPGLENLHKLEDLALGYNAIEKLPNIFGKFSELKCLDLNNNKIKALPKDIVQLPKLESLILNDNQLQTLPNGFEGLGQLQNLFLQNNLLDALPKNLGQLSDLKRLFVSGNLLRTIPDSICKLEKLFRLSLENNLLDALPATFMDLDPNLIISLENNVLDDNWVGQLKNRFRNLSIIAEKDKIEAMVSELIGKKIDQFGPKLKRLGKVQIGDQKIEAMLALREFLNHIPKNHAYSDTVYLPAAKSLLQMLFSDTRSQEERQNALFQITTALGNCDTPVKHFLTQTYIGLHIDNKGEIPEEMYNLMRVMAVEQAILKKFKFGSSKEGIEKTQVLVNSLFLKGFENSQLNPVQILGKEWHHPSITVNNNGRAYINKATAKQFAKMCCKTNRWTGRLRKKQGKYLYDPHKVNAIIDPYLANLGFMSKKERAVATFDQKFNEVLRDHEALITEHFGEPEVIPFVNIANQKAAFRTLLQKVPEHQIKETLERVVQEKRQLAEELSKKYPQSEELPKLGQLAVSQQARLPYDQKVADSDEEAETNHPVCARSPRAKKSARARSTAVV